LNLSEVKGILDEVKLRRIDEPEELGYELRRAIRHAEIFTHGTDEENQQMTEELLQREKMTPEIATKITDVRPMSKDEIRAIYAKERFTLVDEDLEAILDIVLRG